MTDRTRPLDEAVDEGDVTLAFTPGQLVLMAIGAWLLVRWLRGRFERR